MLQYIRVTQYALKHLQDGFIGSNPMELPTVEILQKSISAFLLYRMGSVEGAFSEKQKTFDNELGIFQGTTLLYLNSMFESQ